MGRGKNLLCHHRYCCYSFCAFTYIYLSCLQWNCIGPLVLLSTLGVPPALRTETRQHPFQKWNECLWRLRQQDLEVKVGVSTLLRQDNYRRGSDMSCWHFLKVGKIIVCIWLLHCSCPDCLLSTSRACPCHDTCLHYTSVYSCRNLPASPVWAFMLLEPTSSSFLFCSLLWV